MLRCSDSRRKRGSAPGERRDELDVILTSPHLHGGPRPSSYRCHHRSSEIAMPLMLSTSALSMTMPMPTIHKSLVWRAHGCGCSAHDAIHLPTIISVSHNPRDLFHILRINYMDRSIATIEGEIMSQTLFSKSLPHLEYISYFHDLLLLKANLSTTSYLLKKKEQARAL